MASSAIRKRRPESPNAGAGLKVKLVPIGNSRGVRLPSAVIKQARLGDEVQIVVHDGTIILTSAQDPRAGWDAAFRKALAKMGTGAAERERAEWADWQSMPNDFDEEDWTW